MIYSVAEQYKNENSDYIEIKQYDSKILLR